MKRLLALVLIVFLGVVAWKIGSRLSADAVGLATGVVFGVLAGLPTAVLVLASNRNRRSDQDEAHGSRARNGAYPYGGYPQQPPVIVLANQPAAPATDPRLHGPDRYDDMRALPPPADDPRQFRIVGETGELIEDDYVAH